MVIYSWKTKKVGKEFKAEVTKLIPRKIVNKFGSYVDTKTIKERTFTTRARAKGYAQKWVRYYDKNKL